jgi:hypothetical protein
MSLLIFVTTIALWVRSYFLGEEFERKTWGGGRETFTTIHTTKGALNFGIYRDNDSHIKFSGGWPWSYHRQSPRATQVVKTLPHTRFFLHVGAFQIHHYLFTQGLFTSSIWNMTFPLWLFLPSMIPPLLWWRRRSRLRGFPVNYPATADEASPALATAVPHSGQRSGEARKS